MSATVHDAYVACETVTRQQARNFHYGIRLLPPDKRAAVSAVYALARRIDDIGDGPLPHGAKLRALAGTRRSLHHLDEADDPVLVAVRDAAERYPIPLDAFDELIDGVHMDVVGVRFTTFDELADYCRCVAGSIGRLCVGIFGATDMDVAPRYANTLGMALQQTNILRDVREDFVNGRVYLPTEDVVRFGVMDLRLDAHGALADDGELVALVRWSAERARAWYADGLRLIPLLDRRSAACCAAMAGVYRRLLEAIAANPRAVLQRRVSLSGWQKSVVAARALAGRPA